MKSGYKHSCAILVAGNVFCWGINNQNQTSVPDQGYARNSTSLAVGYQHSCANASHPNTNTNIEPNSTAPAPAQHFNCWGRNEHTQCDTRNLTVHTVATSSAGLDFTCAATSTAISCIGAHDQSQSDPARIGEQVHLLASGAQHACVLTRKQRFKCWGRNHTGQADPPHQDLDTNKNHSTNTAKSVDSSIINSNNSNPANEMQYFYLNSSSTTFKINEINTTLVRKIALGISHSCALNINLILFCWGSNGEGQLDIVSHLISKNKNPIVADLTSIAHATCVSSGVHEVICGNSQGIDTVDVSNGQPRMLSVMVSGVCQVKSESQNNNIPTNTIDCHNQGVKDDRDQDILSNQDQATINQNMRHSVRAMTLGESNTCLHFNNDVFSIKCQGKNRKKINNIKNEYQSQIRYIDTNQNHTCLVLNNPVEVVNLNESFLSRIFCHGDNSYGQIDVPISIRNVEGWTSLGLNFTCILYNKQINKYNQIQQQKIIELKQSQDNVSEMNRIFQNITINFTDTFIINKIEKLTQDIEKMGKKILEIQEQLNSNKSFLSNSYSSESDDQSSIKSIDSSTNISCWGDNSHNQLDIPNLADPITMSVGSGHICAVDGSHAIVCWGADKAGQASAPAATPARGMHQQVISAGFQHSCALDHLFKLSCWGWQTGGHGALLAVPKHITATQIITGQAHTCVMTGVLELQCMGSNEWGQTKVPLGMGLNVFQLFGGWQHNCVTLLDGQVRCWGRDDKGQVTQFNTDATVQGML